MRFGGGGDKFLFQSLIGMEQLKYFLVELCSTCYDRHFRNLKLYGKYRLRDLVVYYETGSNLPLARLYGKLNKMVL